MKELNINKKISLPRIMGATFVCGDIHGHFDELYVALDEIGFNFKEDRLICTGDLIDRGPENEMMINLLITKNWFYSVLGNHDLFPILASNASEKHEADHWLYWWGRNGGEWLNEYKDKEAKYKEISDIFLEHLPLSIELETRNGEMVGVIHADVPLLDWNAIDDYDMQNIKHEDSPVWNRDNIQMQIKDKVVGIDKVYHGHTIVKDIHKLGNRYYIDTGSYKKGGKITVIKVD